MCRHREYKFLTSHSSSRWPWSLELEKADMAGHTPCLGSAGMISGKCDDNVCDSGDGERCSWHRWEAIFGDSGGWGLCDIDLRTGRQQE